MKISRFIGHIIQFIHFIYVIIITIIPYITNDVLLLTIIIINNIGIMLSWYLFGRCVLTDIENYFLHIKDVKIDFMSNIVISYFGEKSKNILFVLYTIPFINTCLCLYKINSQKCDEIPNTPS